MLSLFLSPIKKGIFTIFFFFQSDADYWLLSDADVSITDMWRTERILPTRCSPLPFFVFVFYFCHLPCRNILTVSTEFLDS